MVTELPTWYPQPFRPDGGITAEGLRNQLGRPSLPLLTVLAREAAQNSWDAKVSNELHFSLELGRVAPTRMERWRTLLGAGMPFGDHDQFPLRKLLHSPAIPYLAVSDRGTAGLGGPTRSDQAALPGQRNWLSFVLNSGEARDTAGGGGTYGYGKGIFYLVSRVGAVVIYTRFHEGQVIRSRLIASVLWRSYTVKDRPYTGRHWWGVTQGAHCEPLVDDDADFVASQLGLPSFAGDETGTTVVVLDPRLPNPSAPEEAEEQLDFVTAGQYLADAIGWNLWPLMLPERRHRMIATVTAEGREVPVPDPDTDASIRAFATAYRNLYGDKGRDIECGRPKRRLGRFSFERTFGASAVSAPARDLGVEGSPHHVCLLRSPDLVVRYLEGPPGPHPLVGYAGVAKADDDLDDVFAKAEPPTHDAWIDAQLQGAESTYVRVFHRRIKEWWDELAGTRRQAATIADLPVGGIAQRLGHLVAGAAPQQTVAVQRRSPVPSPGGTQGLTGSFTGSSKDGDSAGAHSVEGRRRISRPKLAGVPRFARSRYGIVLEQRVQLPSSGEFFASVQVVIGDGRLETEAYAGAPQPKVLGWRFDDGYEVAGPRLIVEQAADVTVVVEPVQDAAVEISVGIGQ